MGSCCDELMKLMVLFGLPEQVNLLENSPGWYGIGGAGFLCFAPLFVAAIMCSYCFPVW